MFPVCTIRVFYYIAIYFKLGTLSSPIEQGEMGAKRFTLQAVDGPLNCLYWEIVCHPLHYPLYSHHWDILSGLQGTCNID